MAGGANVVVSCGVSYSQRTSHFRGRLTRQEIVGGAKKYVRYAQYFTTWPDVVAWFGSF